MSTGPRIGARGDHEGFTFAVWALCLIAVAVLFLALELGRSNRPESLGLTPTVDAPGRVEGADPVASIP